MPSYLALESALIDRLTEAVPALRHVGAVSGLAGLDERAAQSPAAYVIYDGEKIADASHDAARQVVNQRWLVVLFVRHAAQDGGVQLRTEAGERLSDLLVALAGWIPPGHIRPITRVNAPRPGYTAAAGWFPLAYEARIVTP